MRRSQRMSAIAFLTPYWSVSRWPRTFPAAFSTHHSTSKFIAQVELPGGSPVVFTRERGKQSRVHRTVVVAPSLLSIRHPPLDALSQDVSRVDPVLIEKILVKIHLHHQAQPRYRTRRVFRALILVKVSTEVSNPTFVCVHDVPAFDSTLVKRRADVRQALTDQVVHHLTIYLPISNAPVVDVRVQTAFIAPIPSGSSPRARGVCDGSLAAENFESGITGRHRRRGTGTWA